MLKLKNLLIIGITILISSCGGTTINFNEEKEYLEERKKIVYYKGTPFSGTILKYHRNGQLDTKTTLKDGKREGLFENYDDDGQLREKNNFQEWKISRTI